jgi:hypothetical protein
VRLAELIGTLSLAVDAGTGLPDHHALRGATLAVGLSREVKADDRTVHDAYYLPLLAMAGCTAESHAAADMLGDEVLVGTESYGLDWGNPREMLRSHQFQRSTIAAWSFESSKPARRASWSSTVSTRARSRK